MKMAESYDLEDFSASYANATAAVDAAIALMEEALSAARYSVEPDSQKYMEMRCYLPYEIREIRPEGTQILLNRDYKPVGSNASITGAWVDYEAQSNLHVSLTKEEISSVVAPGDPTGFFSDFNPPWQDRQAAKDYLQRLQLLANVLKSK